MIEKILAALKKSGVEIYQITEKEEESAELFFIRKNLDMQRRKAVRRSEVVVYKEFWEGEKHFLGSSAVTVQESLSEEEMTGMFQDALYAAGFVKNAYYELYAGQREEMVQVSGGLAERILSETAHCVAEALFAEDVREDVFLNSAEIFVRRYTRHIVNSRGVDVSYRKDRIEGEFVVQCIGSQDVETWQDFAYQDLNTDALRKKVRDTLEMTRARAEAVSAPPAGEYRVILSGGYVEDLLGYYMERSDSAMIYPKYSAFEAGCDVQGTEIGRAHV